MGDNEKYAKIEADMKNDIETLKKRIEALEKIVDQNSENYNKHMIKLHIKPNQQ